MRKFKRLTMTLVALFAMTADAWAEETPLLTIESRDYKTFTSGSKTFDDKVTVTFSSSVDNDGDETGWYSYAARTLTVTAAEGYTITSCKFYTYEGPAANGYTVEGESPSVCLSAWQVLTDDKSVTIGEPGVKKIEVYGAAAPTEWSLTPDANKKVWTLAEMPANDVELEVEYYDPILTLAANNSEWGGFEVTYAGEIDDSKLTLIKATEGLYGDIPENLFDGKTDTKWCCETFDGCYIEFYTENAIEVVGYILTTANDNEDWAGRNPKNWVLKGKLNENGEWETIATVSNDTKMKDVNFTPYQFDADKPGSYKYFRFEIKETTGDNVLQLSEFTLLKKSSLPDITFNEGKYSIIPGAEVTIKAIPAEGYHFDAWSNNEEGYEVGKLRLIIDEDKTITAIFAENEYNITFKAANANTIQAGKATVKVGEAAAEVDEKGKLAGVKMNSKVTVTAKEGYKFRKVEAKKKASAVPAKPEYADNAEELPANTKLYMRNDLVYNGDWIWIPTYTAEQAQAVADYYAAITETKCAVIYGHGDGTEIYYVTSDNGVSGTVYRNNNLTDKFPGYKVYLLK